MRVYSLEHIRLNPASLAVTLDVYPRLILKNYCIFPASDTQMLRFYRKHLPETCNVSFFRS